MALRVTVDTNVLDEEKLIRIQGATADLDVQLAFTTVAERERPGSRSELVVVEDPVRETMVWDEGRWGESVWGEPIHESAILGESVVGLAVISGDESASRLEEILRAIGGGSFPKPGMRDDLTPGERRQLRDAIALEAHARESRDVFVSDDVKAFGRGGDDPRRHRLEALCQTRIVTVDEFCDEIATIAVKRPL
jgi:hypothetical protein